MQLFQVDSFTHTPFAGNPAGICILNEFNNDKWHLNLAAEMNVSETAFLVKNEDHFLIRYFSPTVEVPICGHATLAAAHVIFQQQIADAVKEIKFKAAFGDLSVKKSENWLNMNFPAYKLKKAVVPKNFNKAVGFMPLEIYETDDDWLLALCENQEQLLNLQPNFDLMMQKGIRHLIVTCRGDDKNTDFVSRCFAPGSGINEDPVTGSAHCALTPFWYKKTGKKEFNAKQLSTRGGQLKLSYQDKRIGISGQAVTIFQLKFMQ